MDKAESSQNDSKLSLKDIIPQSAEKGIKPVRNDIPEFDLAEEIMAEHRKVAAAKRKSPGPRPDTQTEPDGRQMEPPPVSRIAPQSELPLPIPDQIIAEIVSRDIEELCWGDMADM